MNASTASIIHLQNITSFESPGLLPIIYATLDPALIPPLDLVDTITDASSRPSCIDSAIPVILCLAIVTTNPSFSPNALVNLCPRLRAWIEFCSDFESVLSSPPETVTLQTSLSVSWGSEPGWSHPPAEFDVRLPQLGQQSCLSGPNVDDILMVRSTPMLALSDLRGSPRSC
ncbi:hypothetical protein FB45DRAFT_873111 [Roridomyces roridus]|uniref:Uncharacterized protein n=1 Tax=Roridomyces roridus TaxID=1738132 RepID=A0AAD7FF55_9AGAR|nr:hypothetical protein FB45DRAFT_873111 [Roridomyces roridus]